MSIESVGDYFIGKYNGMVFKGKTREDVISKCFEAVRL